MSVLKHKRTQVLLSPSNYVYTPLTCDELAERAKKKKKIKNK